MKAISVFNHILPPFAALCHKWAAITNNEEVVWKESKHYDYSVAFHVAQFRTPNQNGCHGLTVMALVGTIFTTKAAPESCRLS